MSVGHPMCLSVHDKTEFIILGKKQQLFEVEDTEVIIGNDSIHNTSSVRNLGFYYDSQLKNVTHINKLMSTLFATIHKISKIKQHDQTTHTSYGLIQSGLLQQSPVRYSQLSSG